MKHMNVPNYLWEEAVRHLTYLINRFATRTLQEQTPYESIKRNNHVLNTYVCLVALAMQRVRHRIL